MKKISYILTLVLMAAAFATLGPRPAFAADTDIAAWQGGGSLYNVDVVKIDVNGVLRIYNTDIVLGNQGVVPSISAGGYYGIKLPCKTVSALTQGDLVTSSNTGTGFCGKGVATSGLTNILGIADGTYAANAIAYYSYAGYALAHTTGTVAIGDLLVSTISAAGYLAANNSAAAGAIVGRALSAGTASGGNTLIILK